MATHMFIDSRCWSACTRPIDCGHHFHFCVCASLLQFCKQILYVVVCLMCCLLCQKKAYSAVVTNLIEFSQTSANMHGMSCVLNYISILDSLQSLIENCKKAVDGFIIAANNSIAAYLFPAEILQNTSIEDTTAAKKIFVTFSSIEQRIFLQPFYRHRQSLQDFSIEQSIPLQNCCRVLEQFYQFYRVVNLPIDILQTSPVSTGFLYRAQHTSIEQLYIS